MEKIYIIHITFCFVGDINTYSQTTGSPCEVFYISRLTLEDTTGRPREVSSWGLPTRYVVKLWCEQCTSNNYIPTRAIH